MNTPTPLPPLTGPIAGALALAVSLVPLGHPELRSAPETRSQPAYSLLENTGAYPAPEPAGDGSFWWKGNLHTHTVWSDGSHFPEVVTQWYVENGYHFLALSDHNIISRGEKWIDPETNRFLARSGGMKALELYRERFGDDWVDVREVDEALREKLSDLPSTGGHAARRPSGEQMETAGSLVRLKSLNEFRHLFEKAGRFILVEAEELTEGSHVVHVNATNILEAIDPITGDSVEETIRLNVDAIHDQSRRTRQPMLPHLNHPNFRWAVTAEDMAPVENLNFFEIYNGHRGVANFGDETHPGLERMWDIVLTRRLAEMDLGIVYGLAVDDAHHYEESESDVARPGRGWVVVRAPFLTPEHLIRALRAGDFYSSSGVTLSRLEADADGIRIEVDTSNDEGNTRYTVQFIGTRRDYDPSSAYRVDDEGNPLTRVTRTYSDDIGRILKEVEGPAAAYDFDGDELYVRARVISTRLHPNPFAEGEREKAWIQPAVPGKGMLQAPVPYD